jgi:hypothetical protein
MEFVLFRYLPENVRLEIWKLAAFVPRVVGVFEAHDFNFDTNELIFESVTFSTTRPTAILSVAKNLGRLARNIQGDG